MTWEQLGSWLAAPLLATATVASKAAWHDRGKQIARITALEDFKTAASAIQKERHEENLRNFADLKAMVAEIRTEQRLVLIDLKAEQRLVLAQIHDTATRARAPIAPTEGE